MGRGQRRPLSTQAFIWDARSGIRGLGVVEGDSASHASGVTRDGRRISGYSVGDNRMRACVWNRDGDRWRSAPLPHDGQLGGPIVPISGDGVFTADSMHVEARVVVTFGGMNLPVHATTDGKRLSETCPEPDVPAGK